MSVMIAIFALLLLTLMHVRVRALCFAAGDCTGPLAPCQSAFFCDGITCRMRIKPNNASCAAARDCTFESLCDGVNAGCPAPRHKPNGTACSNGGANDCQERMCSNGVCISVFKNRSSPCGAAQPCFNAPLCSGNGNVCLPPTVRVGDTCGARGSLSVAEPCRAPDVCDSSGNCLPPNSGGGFVAAGVVCRAAADECDLPEQCSGASFQCPPDSRNASCDACRAAASTPTHPDPNAISARANTAPSLSNDGLVGVTTVAGPALFSAPATSGAALIAGIVGGIGGFLIICAIAAVIVVRIRRDRDRGNETQTTAAASDTGVRSSRSSSQYETVTKVRVGQYDAGVINYQIGNL
jgi:hypothetical protein